MKTIAAAVIEQNGAYLVGQRTDDGGACANLWEFPGGKLEAGETPEECAVRECREELDIEISVDGWLWETVHGYGEQTLRLVFFRASLITGTPQCRVHQQIRWVQREELAALPFCPANEPLIDMLASGTEQGE